YKEAKRAYEDEQVKLLVVPHNLSILLSKAVFAGTWYRAYSFPLKRQNNLCQKRDYRSRDKDARNICNGKVFVPKAEDKHPRPNRLGI
ncbi:MAG: hypothetical protein ACP5E4_04690, partial [Candidatus Aenigmatarchaeota archaeon]